MLNDSMKNIKKAILVLCVAFTGVAAYGQQVSASATLDSLQMTIGQQQTLHLEVNQPADIHISFPVYDQTIMDGIEIVETHPLDTVKHGDRISVIQDYTITSFDTGFYYFDPIVFKVDENLGGGEIQTEPLVLKVFTIPVDAEGDIKDIKQPFDLKYEFREILPWLIGGLILAIVIVTIIWLFRQLMRKEPIIPFTRPKPVEPPHVIALRELNALKDEKLWQTDRIKEFYTRLTDILRVYIEARFKVSAMEQTSEEIIDSLKGELTDYDSAMRNLKQILSVADLVKFAKVKPLPNENDLSMTNGIFFVEQTRPVEVKPIDEVKKDMESGEGSTKPGDENKTTGDGNLNV